MPADLVLDLAWWARSPDRADALVLRRCAGPTLDVGCGPGRMVVELLRRGVPALGIDVVPAAVMTACAAGGAALARSVYGQIPGEGRWPNALLLDGCVGIGGSVDGLLARVGEVLAPGGTALVEHDADPGRAERVNMRLRFADGEHSPPFEWAVVGLRAVVGGATAAGLEVTESWTAHGRAFVTCRRPAV